MYLDELRIRVANRSGSQIMTKPDAQRLRDMIFEKQNEYLNIIKKAMLFDRYSIEINQPFLISANAKHKYIIDKRLQK